MILGTGIDLTDIRRIEESLAKFGEQFEAKIFTQTERDKAHSRSAAGPEMVAATYAKRFAAKEACIKALGMQGISWHNMEITNEANGAPRMTLHGEAQKYLASITPDGYDAAIHLSLSDSYPYAQAQVIIEATQT